MKKFYLKKCAAILAAIITGCTVTPCVSSAAYDDTEKIDPQLLYAERAIVTYLNSYDVDSNAIYLSDSYNVYNLDEEEYGNDVYIVFENDTIIGMLSVTDINGEYYSSFEFNSFDKLQEFYDNNDPISLVSSNEKLYVEESSETYEIYDKDVTIRYNFSITTEAELEKAHKLEIPNSTDLTRVYTYQKNLTVPIVPNESINGGLCWAAAIASKVDFLNTSTYVAHDVYYILAGMYSGTPSGVPLWITRGYDYFGISITTYYRMLNCVEVYNSISSDNPIHIGLFNSSVGHSVLISGITINADGSGIYRLVDSNKLSYVDVIVPADVMTADSDFIYATSYGYTFDHWGRSYVD